MTSEQQRNEEIAIRVGEKFIELTQSNVPGNVVYLINAVKPIKEALDAKDAANEKSLQLLTQERDTEIKRARESEEEVKRLKEKYETH